MPVHEFDERVAKVSGSFLVCEEIAVLQVNVGLRCNQRCLHCHLTASPSREEIMEWPIMERVIEVRRAIRCGRVDITGGAPELNPELARFIEALRKDDAAVQVRTNLSALLEPEAAGLAEFFRSWGVGLVASMPCYLEENVDAQRGAGTYEKSIAALKLLNGLGYGRDALLPLSLVYNPGGPFLPPPQAELEETYRDELGRRFGITFTHLIAITNMPVGRFLTELRAERKEADYRELLRRSFNPAAVRSLMCRHQLCVAWDGTLYDCDFNIARGLPVDHGAPDSLARFDFDLLARRRIVTADHCFGCTAGSGSSCGGQLADGACAES
jgi:radical SAM/Cys-rich protein